MGQQFQIFSWRDGERLWLAALVDAMEEVALRRRAEACDTEALSTLRAQLALPAQIRFASPFSLCN